MAMLTKEELDSWYTPINSMEKEIKQIKEEISRAIGFSKIAKWIFDRPYIYILLVVTVIVYVLCSALLTI